MEYIVLETACSGSLEDAVNGKIVEGFEPLGGASVSLVAKEYWKKRGECSGEYTWK